MSELAPARDWPNPIARAFEEACRDELDAPKPGNVHVFADGHHMTVTDFERSAAAATRPLAATGQRVGARILGAVEASFEAVKSNTNLGIILLCVPLAAAAEARPYNLQSSLSAVLQRIYCGGEDLTFPGRRRGA